MGGRRNDVHVEGWTTGATGGFAGGMSMRRVVGLFGGTVPRDVTAQTGTSWRTGGINASAAERAASNSGQWDAEVVSVVVVQQQRQAAEEGRALQHR
jgi:hypothetical protein